jgi:hypothetical protein
VEIPRPARSHNLPAKLKDTANISEPELSFQRKAVRDFHSRQAQVPQRMAENDHSSALSTPDADLHSSPGPSTDVASTPRYKRDISSISAITDDDSDAESDQPERRASFNSSSSLTFPNLPGITPIIFTAKKRHASDATMSSSQLSITGDQNFEDKGTGFPSRIDCDPEIVAGKKKCATLGNPIVIDADGLLVDVDVQLVDDSPSTREDKRQDVDHFFRPAVIKVVNGKSKKYRDCKSCP